MDTGLLKKIIIVASFRRSGTHLTIDSLINNSSNISTKLLVIDQLSKKHGSNIPLTKFLKKLELETKRKQYIIFKTHQPDSTYPLAAESRSFLENVLANAKKVYVVRDGRDVMVSLWYYLQTIKSEKGNSFTDILNKYASVWQVHIDHWLQKDVYLLKFEDWHNEYEKTLIRLFDFIELPSPQKIKNMVGTFQADLRYDNRLPSILQRILRKTPWKGKRLTTVEPRAGKIGEWENHFSSEDKTIFKHLSGEMLIKLGYEEDNDW